jgi:hypothetical protein
MKKQTAVEWVLNELRTKMGYGNNLGKTAQIIFDVITYEAKAIEKEQLIEAYADGQYLNSVSLTKRMCLDNAESYFNETYGGDK